MDSTLSHISLAMAVFMATVVWVASVENDARKDYAKAGYIVIDKVAYTIKPAATP